MTYDAAEEISPPGAVASASLRDWIQLFRPSHWVKNLFVFAPLLFSGRAFDSGELAQAAAAFAAFCLASSGIYALNDVADRDADMVHPVKRLRPVAAGIIAPRKAVVAGIMLVIAALLISWAVHPAVALFVGLYVGVNVAYMWRLKSIVVLDVFAVASLFVIRLLAGAAAVRVEPSVWLLLCGGLLALYLGFTKRRHELLLLGDDSADHRAVHAHYSPAFLDQISTVLLSVTIVSYIMYTLQSATASAVGTDVLSYSTVFVVYGVFRYIFLVHQREGGSPTETLLNDRQLLIVVAGWLIYCGLVIYRPF